MSTTTNTIADRSEVRQAIRRVLQHHKLTKHGDGVVEADLAHAVVDAIAKLEACSPTDLSHRLRETADQQPGWKPLLTAAADEIERYYGGMMNWKNTAEAKDRTIIELHGKLAKSEEISEKRRVHSQSQERDLMEACSRRDELAFQLLDRQAAAVAASGQHQLLQEAYRAVQNCILVLPEGQFKRDMDDWLTVRLDVIEGPACADAGIDPDSTTIERK